MIPAEPATGTRANISGEATTSDEFPRLLYMCDVPPSNVNGGPILMRRLLAEYPAERLTVGCAAHFLHVAGATILPCEHVTFFRTSGTGRWGLGRLKQLVDVLAVPQIQSAAEKTIRKKRIAAVLTVAHDLFFLDAVGAARKMGVPCVMVVHDDWISAMASHTFMPRGLAPRWFSRALHGASRVYAVSEGVQEWLASEFGVASELQLPATEAHDDVNTRARAGGPLRIVYTGTSTAGPATTLGMLVKALVNEFATESWSLDLYGVSEEVARSRGWTDRRIRAHSWVSQEEIRGALRDADVVFLPMGFDAESRKFAVRSFPSKLTDYFAAGRATLVCAPTEASVSKYVRQHDCAELVEEPSPQRLAEALRRLMDPQRREERAERGLEMFRRNHDIRAQRQEFVADLKRLIAESRA